MAMVRTPPPGGGVDQALEHWQDYKQQAMHELAQMKGHIAEADKLRAQQKTADRIRELEQELAVARAWRQQTEKELQTVRQERDESRLAAQEWESRYRHSEAAVGDTGLEIAATREEACNSARECAELVLQVRQLEAQMEKERQQHQEEREQQLRQTAAAMQTLSAAASRSAEVSVGSGSAADTSTHGLERKPWDSPASTVNRSFHATSYPSNENAEAEAPVSVAVLAKQIIALREERNSAQAACESLDARLAAAVAKQRGFAETIQQLREANAKANEAVNAREREQSLAAVAAAVAIERQKHSAALREREAQWRDTNELLVSGHEKEQQAWSNENEGLRAQLAELQVQTTGLRAALATKSNEISGTQANLGRQLADAETIARAAESAARVAEQEAEELRLELHELRAAQNHATSLEREVKRAEKERKAAETEMIALRAELDAVVRENAELGEANRMVESKLFAGREAVAAAVAEADILRGEWEEERIVVQQTMKEAEQRLQQQATALTAVAAVSPAASAAIQRVQQQQEQQQHQSREQSPQRSFTAERSASARVVPSTPESPARQLAEPPPEQMQMRQGSRRVSSRPAGSPVHNRSTELRSTSRRSHSERAPRRGSTTLRLSNPEEATKHKQQQLSSQRGQGRSSTQGQSKVARERGADYARQVEERDEMLRQITDVAGREFVRRNGLTTAPIARVQEVLHSARLQALAHVRTTAGKQVAHALAFAPVEEIETATLSMLGTPAQPLQGRHAQGYIQPAGVGMHLSFAAAGESGVARTHAAGSARHETV